MRCNMQHDSLQARTLGRPAGRLTRRQWCAGVAAALGAAPAAAQFRVEISGVGATQIPVAVARFRDEDGAAPSLGVVSARPP